MKNPLARSGAKLDTLPPVGRTVEPPSLNSSIRRVRDHLLVTSDGTWAWYKLGPVPWSFRSPAERSTLLGNVAQRWAELVGTTVHLRITSHPVPYSTWARRLHSESPNRLEDGWPEYLAASQERIRETRSDSPGVYLGIRITTRKLTDTDLARVAGDRGGKKLPSALATARGELDRITEAVSREGFNAEPVSERGMGWLIHASVALGHPVSEHSIAVTGTEGWGPGDVEAFTLPVSAYSKPLSGCVNITAARDGHVRTNSVAFASLSRLSPRDTDHPILAPWMAFPMKFPYPVEWSMIGKVVAGKDMRKRAEYDLTRARSISRGFRHDHDEDPTPDVDRAIRLAEQVADEVNTGTSEIATRIIGPIRIAVHGATDEDALARLRSITSAFAGGEQRIEILHPIAGQHALYQEFIPGEEHRRMDHVARALPARFLATSVPNAATGLGDDYGPYLGQVIGSSRNAVFFDPTSGLMDPENNKSGLCVIGGEPGSGKSSLGGGIAESGVRRGHRAIILDPSGPLARLTTLPHLRKVSRHIDLSGAKPGTLNPYQLVPIPLRENYDTDTQHQDAIAEATAERRELMIDSIHGILSNPRPDYYGLLERAVSECPAEVTSNPWEVVHYLERKGGALERELAGMIRQTQALKGARLIFPLEDADASGVDDLTDVLLTVITMPGLTTPAPGSDRAHWSRAERMSVVMLHLAARFAQRAMYADKHPKVIIVDEGGIAGAAGSSFQTFMLRGSRDSRKHNTFFALLVQNPADAVGLSPEINNLIGTAFMGRLTGSGPRKAGLELLNVTTGVGYEGVFGSLRSGEFVMCDYKGRVDTMRIDFEHRPDLHPALYTTPPANRDTADETPVLAELVLAR